MTAKERLAAPPESMRLVGDDEDLGKPLWTVEDGKKTKKK